MREEDTSLFSGTTLLCLPPPFTQAGPFWLSLVGYPLPFCGSYMVSSESWLIPCQYDLPGSVGIIPSALGFEKAELDKRQDKNG